MKKITTNTILKQGDKTFTAVEVDGNIVWIDKTEFADETIAQTKAILQGIPVILLDSYVERLAEKDADKYDWDFESSSGNGYADHVYGFIKGYKSNPAKWTDEDMERAIELSRIKLEVNAENEYLTKKQIFEQLSEISVIEVDNDFNVLNYR